MSQKRLLTAKETAKQLSCSDSFLYKLAKENRIPSMKIGAKAVCFEQEVISNLFNSGEFDRLKNRHRHGGAREPKGKHLVTAQFIQNLNAALILVGKIKSDQLVHADELIVLATETLLSSHSDHQSLLGDLRNLMKVADDSICKLDDTITGIADRYNEGDKSDEKKTTSEA